MIMIMRTFSISAKKYIKVKSTECNMCIFSLVENPVRINSVTAVRFVVLADINLY